MADYWEGSANASPSDVPTIRSERRAYFAYGANMSPEPMKTRCPGASFVCAARLQGQFRINSYGVATIELDRKSVVHGILWTITPADEMALDEFEGVEIGFYQKRDVEIVTQCGKQVRAFAYVATDARPGRPRAGYLTEIIAAANLHGFPRDYIRQLVEWLV
jgi:gamma-glutamylcyclotransferase (GGCT)/AIG2-like uncharacterized protein YtfP